MIHRDPFRLWVATNLQPIAFLGAYFATIVAGNLIFASPLGATSLRATGFSPRILEMPHIFSFGYWALLLCPFVIAPLVVIATRRSFGPLVARSSLILQEFGRAEYLFITGCCYAFMLYRFWQADVAGLFVTGTDEVSSVNARFAIHHRIGYWTLMVLQALMPFLAIYSLIRWMRSREWFWFAMMVLNIVAMSVLLALLNMKWPVLLFYVGLVMAVFVNAKRRAYLKAAIGTLFLLSSFLMISALVFRIAPGTQVAKPHLAVVEPTASPASATPSETPRATKAEGMVNLADTSRAAIGNAPGLLLAALNRMAVLYPYYYETFTSEGAVCGGVLQQAQRAPKCRPSTLIYSRIFGTSEGYTDAGTSPQSVHISGYALGGWPIAMCALVAGSILLGLFASLPLDRSVSTSALAIVGALAGYHLSQVPGEGVILFDHGLLWTFLMICAFLTWRAARRVWRTKPTAVRSPKSSPSSVSRH